MHWQSQTSRLEFGNVTKHLCEHTHTRGTRLMFWCFHVLMTISSRREATWFKPSGCNHADMHNKNGHAATLPPPSLSPSLSEHTASQLPQQPFLSSALLSQSETLKDLMLVCVCIGVLDIRADTSLDGGNKVSGGVVEEKRHHPGPVFAVFTTNHLYHYIHAIPCLTLGVHVLGCLFSNPKRPRNVQPIVDEQSVVVRVISEGWKLYMYYFVCVCVCLWLCHM